jgi:hypothetical protein
MGVGDYGLALLLAGISVLWLVVAGAPIIAGARAAVSTPAPIPVGQASFDYNPLTSLKANPTITGSASSSAPLRFTATDASGTLMFSDQSLWVSGGRFSETIYPPIANGAYSLAITLGSTTLATSTLTVGLRTEPIVGLDDSLSSYDVADGHLMRFTLQARGTSGVGVGQLSFAVMPSNATVQDISLYGYTDPNFTIPIIASSTGLLNSTSTEISATSSVVTIVPDTPIEISAGDTYYFDLVGTVTPQSTAYNVETTLLNDTDPHFGVYNDIASTSNLVWSPNTYGVSSPDMLDWINGALVGGVPQDGLIEVRTNPPPTNAPACSLDASTSSAPQGTPVTLTWSTTGATSVVWDTGAHDAFFGVKTYTLGSTTHTYILNVSGPYGQSNCFATVVVPSATVVATTTVDGFTATPTTGSIPLSVTFAGSVNNAKSCAAQTFSLGYGDGATSTIAVAVNVCKAQAFTFTHSYTKVGTTTAGLYKGVGTSTAQRIQTQVIVAKAKVAFNGNTSNMAAALVGFLSGFTQVFQTITRWFAW